MRSVDAGTLSRFTQKASSLCTCWRITRQDGAVLGLTDHDRPLEFSGTVFSSMAGADGSALEETTSLASDNAEILGILIPSFFEEQDLAIGKYDGAKIEVFRVDWKAPEHRLMLRLGTIGEVDYDGTNYRAEFRSLKHALDRPSGRQYGRGCDTELGSSLCGVILSGPQYTFSGIVMEAASSELTIALEAPVSEVWLEHGLVEFTSGALAGIRRPIFRQRGEGDTITISLWQDLALLPEAEAPVQLVAGCDKAFETCRTKFSNHMNFRGFPYIPGPDVIFAYPRSGETSTI